MKKIDRIISIIREMMVANSPGSSSGFSGSSPAEGPTAGFDPLLGFRKRNKIDYRKVPKNYKSWVKSLEK